MDTTIQLAIVALALTLTVASAQFAQTSNTDNAAFAARVLKGNRRRRVCRGGLAKQKGFNAVLMFIADGRFSQLSPNQNIPSCEAIGCDGAYFWNEVIRVGEKVRRRETRKAKKFFLEGWGIPVDDYVEKGKILFMDTYTDPRLNYRCRAMEDETIHRFGWEVHDQIFMVVMLEELKLGGKRGGGRTVPPSSLLVFGQYAVEKSKVVNGKVVGMREFVRLHYVSTDPIFPAVNGIVTSSCKITKSPWGTGLALVTFNVGQPSKEPTKFVGRNVITLDGRDGTGKFDGVFV